MNATQAIGDVGSLKTLSAIAGPKRACAGDMEVFVNPQSTHNSKDQPAAGLRRMARNKEITIHLAEHKF
jgi:hypothetical protein